MGISGIDTSTGAPGADVAGTGADAAAVERIKVTVDVPAGLPSHGVGIFFKPETTAEFEAIVDACGGPAAFSHVYGNEAYASIAGATTVYLTQPKDAKPVERPAPFMDRFKERVAEARAEASS